MLNLYLWDTWIWLKKKTKKKLKMSYCVVPPIAVCLYVQILPLAQSADTLEFVEASVCFIAVSYTVLCSKLHSLLTGIKDDFCLKWILGFVLFCWGFCFNFPQLKNYLKDNSCHQCRVLFFFWLPLRRVKLLQRTPNLIKCNTRIFLCFFAVG